MKATMRQWMSLAVMAMAGAGLAGCGQSSTPTSQGGAATPPGDALVSTPTAAATPAVTPAAAQPTATPSSNEGINPMNAAAGAANEAPAVFRVRFDTSKGPVVAEFHKDWSPQGVQRIYDLVQAKFFDEARLFRMLPGFVVQFGIAADPAVSAQWRNKNIPDEPVKGSNMPGIITYAKGGPNTRTTQIFINLGNNARLDAMGFSPIGQVVEGMDIVETFNGEYDSGPSDAQSQIQAEGNAFLSREFPNLDYIKTATIAP
jgi:peptidyl-prolyl cis-trans isomerase A (cyclophilin A)